MNRPQHRCGRCGKRASAWKRDGICKGCQRDLARERAAEPTSESLREFRQRLKGSA